MKRALLSGITGQDGSYLAELLLKKGYEVHGLVRPSSTDSTSRIKHLLNQVTLWTADILDRGSISIAMKAIKPDEVYHLACQSHVRLSFDLPSYTIATIVTGTINVLDTMCRWSPNCRFYNAATSEMFGNSPGPQNELTPFDPQSPYAEAKVRAYELLQRDYRQSFVVSGILFNHESPRRGELFLTRKVTKAIARIIREEQRWLTLGNLDAKRDWGYTPDYVEAMWMMLQQETPKNFVIGTGETHSVREFVEHAFSYAHLDWLNYAIIDPSLERPAEVNLLQADPRRANEQLCWKHKTGFTDLVKLMVDYDLKHEGK